jgi:hypothetical protein
MSDIMPPQKIRFEDSLIFISCFFSLGIIALSLYRFPWWSIILILVTVSLVSFWAWRFFFASEEAA